MEDNIRVRVHSVVFDMWSSVLDSHGKLLLCPNQESYNINIWVTEMTPFMVHTSLSDCHKYISNCVCPLELL